jgi:predicted RNase H-like HicB family nuclease
MDHLAVSFEEGRDGTTIWCVSNVVPVMSAGKDRAEAEVNFAEAMRLYEEAMQEHGWVNCG